MRFLVIFFMLVIQQSYGQYTMAYVVKNGNISDTFYTKLGVPDTVYQKFGEVYFNSGPLPLINNSPISGVIGLQDSISAKLTADDAVLPNLQNPSSAPNNKIKLFTYKIGGRPMPGYIDEYGLDNGLQSLLTRNTTKIFLPAGNSTTVTSLGMASLTATGTATALSVSTTNRYTQIKGMEYLVTVAAANAIAGFREGGAQHFIGNSAGNGGFHFICRFGPATGVATATNRCFVGMSAATGAPTDVEPSTLTSMMGVGWDAADANIQWFNNDGSGTATKTSLGIAVPTAVRASVYEISFFCPPNSTVITYTFKDLAQGGSTVSGTVSTDLPAANTLLAARGWISAGGTSSVIGFGIKSLYIESDY